MYIPFIHVISKFYVHLDASVFICSMLFFPFKSENVGCFPPSVPSSSVTHLKTPRPPQTLGVEACGWTTLVPDTVSHHNLGQSYSLCAVLKIFYVMQIFCVVVVVVVVRLLKAVTRGWAVGHIAVPLT